jgi:hypothetical protein
MRQTPPNQRLAETMSAKTYAEEGLQLYWERAEPAQSINFAYDDKALVALEEFFGAFPITLSRSDIKVLRALMTAGGGRPLDAIVNAIEKNGEIRIWWKPQRRVEMSPPAVSFG